MGDTDTCDVQVHQSHCRQGSTTPHLPSAYTKPLTPNQPTHICESSGAAVAHAAAGEEQALEATRAAAAAAAAAAVIGVANP